MRHRSSAVLVALQLGLIAVIVLGTGWPVSPRAWPPAIFLLAMSIVLFAWTIGHNRLGNFSVLPEPRRSARLVTSGPYRWIRHPMYVAVLLGGTSSEREVSLDSGRNVLEALQRRGVDATAVDGIPALVTALTASGGGR